MKKIRVRYSKKIHYYNGSDAMCRFTFHGDIYNQTYCGRSVLDIMHTEFKNSVTCRKCVQRILRIDKLNESTI